MVEESVVSEEVVEEEPAPVVPEPVVSEKPKGSFLWRRERRQRYWLPL